MTKAVNISIKDMAAQISADNDITKTTAERIIKQVFELIADAVNDEMEVVIHGFGKFKPSVREERQGRNPSTGAAITIPASKTIKFKPSASVKAAA